MKPGNWAVSRQRRRGARGRHRLLTCPRAEALEARLLPAVLAFPTAIVPLSEAEPNDTVDAAQGLGDLSIAPAAGVSGRIGDGQAAAADVDWYHFVLDRPARVSLVSGPRNDGESFRGVVSLYNEDPLDFADPLDPLGHRLLAQGQAGAAGGLARVDTVLGPGAYDVAVSGAANRFFHPLLAGSGYDGSTGDYNLLADATDLGLGQDDGPAILSSEPLPGAVLDRSPLAIRLGLSGPLDPGTVVAGQTVQLLFNPAGTFGDGNDRPVALAAVNFSAAAGELQLFPSRALEPGSYRVILAGDSSLGVPVLASPAGTPLGAKPSFPRGYDYAFDFQVTGIEGGSTAPDTLATAHDLGELTTAGLVQVEGAIGNDPFFDRSSPDPTAGPGNGVVMYHFQVAGAGRYSLLAEVFAGRIGSPLDPGVALYRLDPSGQTLTFLDGNNNTGDAAPASDGTTPLSSDAALFDGLTSGDYYLAVSSGSNTPSPLEGQPPGTTGLYDPTRSHSGRAGFSTGPYVLNVLVRPATGAPRVLATGPGDSAILDAPPTELTVRFDEPVNLQQLSYQAYQLTTQTSLPSVFVLGPDGTRYFPRFESFDKTTDTATFLMLEALPDGANELHLSGAAGLTDLAGEPLDGNTSAGDYVTRFVVDGPARGTLGDPLTRTAELPAAGPQDLGIIFPHEWQAGVHLTRDSTANPAGDSEDAYRFRVIQRQTYSFRVAGTGLGTGSSPLSLTDAMGGPVDFGAQGDGSIILADLPPGTYVLHVGSWAPDRSADVVYRLTMAISGVADNPPPLVNGPSPALQVRLNSLPGSSPANPGGPAGGQDPPSSGGTSPSTSIPVVSGPTTTPVGTGYPGGPAGGQEPPSSGFTPASPSTTVVSASSPGSALGLVASSSAFPTPTSLGSLYALSVAPVGSLNGNTGVAPSSTQVAFALPSPGPSAPSLGESLIRLIVMTRMLGDDLPAGTVGPDFPVPGGEVGGPARVFEEGLRPAFAAAPVAPENADTVVGREPALAAPPTSRGTEDAASGTPALSGTDKVQGPAGEGGAEDPGSETRLADLGWGMWLATLAAALLVLIKRFRSARGGPAGSSGPDRSSRRASLPTRDHLGRGLKGGRGRRSLLSRIKPRWPVRTREQGLYS